MDFSYYMIRWACLSLLWSHLCDFGWVLSKVCLVRLQEGLLCCAPGGGALHCIAGALSAQPGRQSWPANFTAVVAATR